MKRTKTVCYNGASVTHRFVTHHLWHTIFYTPLWHTHTHHLWPSTLSHTHTIFHTPLCHTPSLTHHFVTHHLSHTTFFTIFHHTILHTPLCHTPSFTTPSFTHNFVAHHLSPHHLSHTTLSHTIFHHTSFTHTTSRTIFRHTILHTPLCHTIFHHTIFHTHNFVTQLCHTHAHTIFLCHTPSFTCNFVTHNFVLRLDPPPPPLSFLPSPSPLQHVVLIIGRSCLVGLSGPLIGNIHLWVSSSVSFLLLLRYLISAPSSQRSSVSQFFSQHSMSTLSTLPAQLCHALSHRWSSPHPPWLYKTHPLDRGCPKDTSLLLISGRFQWWKRCRIQRCAGRFLYQDVV